MALVQYERISKFGVENRFHCGGSLINSRYVLTAAHCVDIDSNVELVDRGSNDDYVVRVRLGEWNIKDCPDQLNKISECARPHLDIVVEETIKHPKFRRIKNRFLNDIALLRLNMPVSFTKAISPICLKMGDDIGLPSYKSPVVGTKMTVAGWGKTGVDAPMSSQLLKTELIRMPLSSCSKHYGSLNNFYICAGTNNGNDTCKGDSGGPLMSLFGDKTYLVGITSFGATNCGARDFPSLYVRTLPYLNWIEKNLRL
ncbi:hypothetical protein KR074_006568 [Drosophila pseudoananassae]|nr:hypothetical protein KR074_006568 [Drosophila pseudoananassae]